MDFQEERGIPSSSATNFVVGASKRLILTSKQCIQWKGVNIIYFNGLYQSFIETSECKNYYCARCHTIEVLFRSPKATINILPARLTQPSTTKGIATTGARLLIQIESEYLENLAFNLFGYQIKILPKLNFFDLTIYYLASLIRTKLDTKLSNEESDLYLSSLVMATAITLLDQYCSVSKLTTNSKNTLSKEQLQIVLNHIDERLNESITLLNLANCLHMSKTSFSNLFKNSLKISPYQYVMRKRIKLAEKLLKESNLSITEIAENAGFKTSSHFSRSFRRYTKISPKDYRQRRRKGSITEVEKQTNCS